MTHDATTAPTRPPLPADEVIAQAWNASGSSWDCAVYLGVWHADLLLRVRELRATARGLASGYRCWNLKRMPSRHPRMHLKD